MKVVVTPHGGHCAFVERGNGEYDGYWAEREIVRFVTSSLQAGPANLRAGLKTRLYVRPRFCIRIFANSGPLPLSSCLK